jgi:hypothetical protein
LYRQAFFFENFLSPVALLPALFYFQYVMRWKRWAAIGFLLLSAGMLLMFAIRILPAGPSDPVSVHFTNYKDFPVNPVLLEPLSDAVNPLFAKLRSDRADSEPDQDILPWQSRFYGVSLRGTAGTAMAVLFEHKTRAEHVVRAGDTVGQAEVREIDRNYVMLDGPAGAEILRLPADTRQPVAQQPNARFSDSESHPGGDLRVIERDKLRNLVTRVDQLANEIAFQPVRDAEGLPAGFRVSMLKPGGLLAQMGLRRGDTLMTINHQRILTVEDAFRILESSHHQNTLALSILRNQQTMEFHYVIR